MKHYTAKKFIFRVSVTDQSLISQFFPINFNSLTQSTHIEQKESTNIKSTSSITFRPIISKSLSKNVFSSTNDNISQMLYSNSNHLLVNNDQQDNSSTYQSIS